MKLAEMRMPSEVQPMWIVWGAEFRGERTRLFNERLEAIRAASAISLMCLGCSRRCVGVFRRRLCKATAIMVTTSPAGTSACHRRKTSVADPPGGRSPVAATYHQAAHASKGEKQAHTENRYIKVAKNRLAEHPPQKRRRDHDGNLVLIADESFLARNDLGSHRQRQECKLAAITSAIITRILPQNL